MYLDVIVKVSVQLVLGHSEHDRPANIILKRKCFLLKISLKESQKKKDGMAIKTEHCTVIKNAESAKFRVEWTWRTGKKTDLKDFIATERPSWIKIVTKE